VNDSRQFQQEVRRSLNADPGAISRNSDLIWTWDFLSLALCLDWAPCTAHAVPTRDGPADLELTADGHLTPWPFNAEALTVRAEGRRLDGPYDSDAALAEALRTARWETVAFELRSA
jgi:hypothetical protein